ncbi:hypothetical protein FSST1_006681 [Fusarium sambucinum]
MAPFNNVLLIGAGGNLGVPVTKAFLKTSYNVSILSRQESTSTFPDGVTVFKVDYKDTSAVTAAMKGQDVVICMTGGIAAGDQNVFIDAAVSAGVKRFFPSEFGPYSLEPGLAELNPWLFPHKIATAKYLQSKESQMSWTGLITGAFFDWAMKAGFFQLDIATKSINLIDNGTAHFSATTLSTIAKALIACLDHAEETKNQYVFISSFVISQQNILDAVEKVDGHKWNVEHITSDWIIERGQKRLGEGDFAGIKDLTNGAAFGYRAMGNVSRNGLWNERLGLPKEDLEQAVKDVL